MSRKRKSIFIILSAAIMVAAALFALICFVLPAATGNKNRAGSKKGIQLSSLYVEDAIDLDVKWGLVNFTTGMMSTQKTPYSYEKDGRTYYFDEATVEIYDDMLKKLSDRGVNIVATILNERNDEFPELYYPGTGDSPQSGYFAFNTENEEGRSSAKAFAEFLVDRYSGKEYGRICGWLVGNEVNDNLQYHYMGPCDMETYVKAYYEEFKLFYDVIKSHDKNAVVYIPLEHRWQTANTMTDYGGRWFLEYFHELELRDKEMDWGLAWHPYPYPLGDPDTLDDGDYPTIDTDETPSYGGEVTLDYTTPIISMKNLDILTDYFKENLLTEKGKVRDIILSEVGYTSYSVVCGKNEAKQAANIAYALYKADANPYIKALIIRAHCDEDEGSPYFKFGLRYDPLNGGEKKLAYDVYKYAGTKEGKLDDAKLLAVLGADSWDEIIPGYRGRDYEKKKAKTDRKNEVSAAGKTDISDCVIDVDERTCYTGRPVSVRVMVKDGNRVLTDGEDYNVSYSSNVDPGEATAVIVGIGDYKGFVTRSFEIEGKYAAILDPAWYFDRNEEAKLACGGDYSKAEDYFFSENIKEGVQGAEEFNVFCYMVNYPELEDEFWEEPEGAYLHYVKAGKKKGLEASGLINNSVYRGVDYSLVYDEAYIIRNYPDIWEKCGKNSAVLLRYFVREGIKSGMRGNEIFDLDMYKEHNPDLAEAFGDDPEKYYIHFITDGFKEKRTSCEALPTENTDIVFYGTDYSDVFNAEEYIERYPDAAKYAGKDKAKALEHFVIYGMKEGRIGCKDFDPVMYKALYSDVREAFGDVMKLYFVHYMYDGKKEGRFTATSVIID